LTKLFELSRQSVSPVTSVSPLKITVESESVLKVISLVESGVKIEDPDAFNGCPLDTVNPPFSVASPVRVDVPSTDRLLLIVVVPLVAPREIVVASPPMFSVVAVVLKIKGSLVCCYASTIYCKVCSCCNITC